MLKERLIKAVAGSTINDDDDDDLEIFESDDEEDYDECAICTDDLIVDLVR